MDVIVTLEGTGQTLTEHCVPYGETVPAKGDRFYIYAADLYNVTPEMVGVYEVVSRLFDNGFDGDAGHSYTLFRPVIHLTVRPFVLAQKEESAPEPCVRPLESWAEYDAAKAEMREFEWARLRFSALESACLQWVARSEWS
jgi:hypothetical protein